MALLDIEMKNLQDIVESTKTQLKNTVTWLEDKWYAEAPQLETKMQEYVVLIRNLMAELKDVENLLKKAISLAITRVNQMGDWVFPQIPYDYQVEPHWLYEEAPEKEPTLTPEGQKLLKWAGIAAAAVAGLLIIRKAYVVYQGVMEMSKLAALLPAANLNLYVADPAVAIAAAQPANLVAQGRTIMTQYQNQNLPPMPAMPGMETITDVLKKMPKLTQ